MRDGTAMVEAYLRRSALAHLHLPARAAAPENDPARAGVVLAERPHRAQIDVRGDAADLVFLSAVENATRITLPTEPNTVRAAEDLSALWLGPDEWLIVGPPGRERDLVERLREELANQHAAVTDVSEARTVIALAGPRARDLIAKGTSLDLHPRVFGPGRCAQSGMAGATMILHQVDDRPTFEIYVLDSFADYLWTWLERAGAELGIAIAAEA
jgi:sarcosine oxidase subunit gamma